MSLRVGTSKQSPSPKLSLVQRISRNLRKDWQAKVILAGLFSIAAALAGLGWNMPYLLSCLAGEERVEGTVEDVMHNTYRNGDVIRADTEVYVRLDRGEMPQNCRQAKVVPISFGEFSWLDRATIERGQRVSFTVDGELASHCIISASKPIEHYIW